MVASDDAEGDFTAHYFDSRAVTRVLHMSFQDRVWTWWRHATGPDDLRPALRRRALGRRCDGRELMLPRQDGEWIHDFAVTYTRA
jgi:hypothetical protein